MVGFGQGGFSTAAGARPAVAAALFLFFLVWGGMATAGIVVTSEQRDFRDRMTQSREYYGNGRYRGDGTILSGGGMTIMDEKAGAYWQGAPERFCEAVKKMKAAMESLVPAEYREKPISQRKVTRRKIGTKTIAGFAATGYEFFVDGRPSGGKVWVSDAAGLSDLIAARRSIEKEFECKGMDEDSTNVQASELYKKTVEGKIVLDDGFRKVVSVEKKSIPVSVFSPPSGYRRFSSYEDFMEYVEARQ